VPTPAARTYVVVDGDTLTKISLQFYGTARRWREIYEANRDTLPNESVLSIGSTLVIP
jgi:nucleoid-associated protein YgaU